jgi:hypothetical protein
MIAADVAVVIDTSDLIIETAIAKAIETVAARRPPSSGPWLVLLGSIEVTISNKRCWVMGSWAAAGTGAAIISAPATIARKRPF